jgi:chromatin remodeling complex protein RSC6
MENLVIKLEINLGNINQVADAIKLLTPFNAEGVEVKNAEIVAPAKTKTKKQAAEPVKDEPVKDEPAKAETAKAETAKAETAKAETAKAETAEEAGPRIEDIRQEVAKKAINFRTEIKGELTRLDASNVSGLDAKHYTVFMGFLTALK